MKTTTKTVLGLIALVIIIVASTILYNKLSEQYTPENTMSDTADENQNSSDSDAQDKEAFLAQDFSMEDAQGNTVKLSDFIGKPIVLNFWASWCPPCKSEMPDFETVYKELGEDVTFIMLNATDGSRETKEIAQNFIEEQGFSFPVFYDTSMEASYAYGVSSLPTTVFIDKDGYLITGAIGSLSEESLRGGIEMIMNNSEEEKFAEYNKITATQAKTMMENETDYILLDVRTQEEFDQKHIEGAILIPDTEIATRAEDELTDKSQKIFVYCRSGNRSKAATKKLIEMGYTNVYDFGGINDWQYDTVN